MIFFFLYKDNDKASLKRALGHNYENTTFHFFNLLEEIIFVPLVLNRLNRRYLKLVLSVRGTYQSKYEDLMEKYWLFLELMATNLH